MLFRSANAVDPAEVAARALAASEGEESSAEAPEPAPEPAPEASEAPEEGRFDPSDDSSVSLTAVPEAETQALPDDRS
mgnify:CR=1 FL=1